MDGATRAARIKEGYRFFRIRTDGEDTEQSLWERTRKGGWRKFRWQPAYSSVKDALEHLMANPKNILD